MAARRAKGSSKPMGRTSWASREQDARKTWEEVARELNRKFGTKRTGDKCKKKMNYFIERYKIANEYQTTIRLGEEWSTCKALHEFYVNAAVSLEKRHSGFASIHLPISDTVWKRQTLAAVACR